MSADKTSVIIPALFVDDIFVDLTSNCVKSLLEYDRPHQILVIEGGTFAENVNRGLEAATGDFLAIVNNDITFLPGALTELLKPLKMGYDISTIRQTDMEGGHFTEDKITEGNKFGAIWAITRQAYEQLGLLDERFGKGTFEDLDYRRRAMNAGLKIAKNHNGLVEHLGSATFNHVDPEHKWFDKNKKVFKDKWGFVE